MFELVIVIGIIVFCFCLIISPLVIWRNGNKTNTHLIEISQHLQRNNILFAEWLVKNGIQENAESTKR